MNSVFTRYRQYFNHVTSDMQYIWFPFSKRLRCCTLFMFWNSFLFYFLVTFTHRNAQSWSNFFKATLAEVLQCLSAVAVNVLGIFIKILPIVLMVILCLPFIFVEYLYRTYMPNNVAFKIHREYVFCMLIAMLLLCVVLLLKIKDALFLVIASLWRFVVFLWYVIKV